MLRLYVYVFYIYIYICYIYYIFKNIIYWIRGFLVTLTCQRVWSLIPGPNTQVVGQLGGMIMMFHKFLFHRPFKGNDSVTDQCEQPCVLWYCNVHTHCGHGCSGVNVPLCCPPPPQ